MEDEAHGKRMLLPHHEQQELCVTRAPYRQGRRLTAVKVYSITKESNHLLVFGVPSLNLRQEAKALFIRFGKLLQFNISKEHAAEPFTETYHACYERIQSARIAKRILDTKNFYGGSLHICYAPELESISETEQKLKQRQKEVLFRLRNLQTEGQLKDSDNIKAVNAVPDKTEINGKKLINMGEVNIIYPGNDFKRGKRKTNEEVKKGKKIKPCFIENEAVKESIGGDNRLGNNNGSLADSNVGLPSSDIQSDPIDVTNVSAEQIVDCTSVDRTVISNINEALNYDKFGNETVYKVPIKPVNRIKFNLNKKSSIY